jgi:hypothetical protein
MQMFHQIVSKDKSFAYTLSSFKMPFDVINLIFIKNVSSSMVLV